MRPNDLKVQTIAREVGMLYKCQGETTEYSRPITVVDPELGELTMEFAFQTPDEVAYIEIYQKGKRRPIDVYMEDFEDVRTDYPQFFQD